MINALISRIAVILFGTLYPAYSSYKALKTKNTRSLVKWMMYWIVYAFFTAMEAVTDLFLSWVPMYYESKVLFIIWLLSPATKGTSYLYRKLVHPNLEKHEEDIDKYLSEASKKGAETLLNVGVKSLNLAASTVLTTAIQGQDLLVDQLRKSYSTSDISSTGSIRENLTMMDAVKEGDSSDDDDLDAGLFSDKSANLVKGVKGKYVRQTTQLSKVPEHDELHVSRIEPQPVVKRKTYSRSVSAPASSKKV